MRQDTSSKVLVDHVGSSGAGVRVGNLCGIRTLVAVQAGNGILDLVRDALVLSGGAGVGRAVGHTRHLVVSRLASGLVVIGLEVSACTSEELSWKAEEEARQTWQCGRRGQ
jgi:hypothetical protein